MLITIFINQQYFNINFRVGEVTTEFISNLNYSKIELLCFEQKTQDMLKMYKLQLVKIFRHNNILIEIFG